MQQGSDELDLLLHALGELFHFALQLVRDFQPLAPLHRLLFGGCSSHAVELRQKDKMIEYLHLFIKTALFRQVANMVEVLPMKRLAEHAYFSRIRRSDADLHANGACLSRAIRAQQAKYCSLLNAEGEVVNGHKLVVCLPDIVQFYGVHVLKESCVQN